MRKGLKIKSIMAKTLLAFLLILILIFAQGQFFVSHAEPSPEKTAKARWTNYMFVDNRWQSANRQSVNVTYTGTGTVPADLNVDPHSFDSTLTYYDDYFGKGYYFLYVKWDNRGCEAGNVTLNVEGLFATSTSITPYEGNTSIFPDEVKSLLDGTNQGTSISTEKQGQDYILEFSVPADKVSYVFYIMSKVDMITYDITDSVDTADTSDTSDTSVNGSIRWGTFVDYDNKWVSGMNQIIDATYSGSGKPIADLNLPNDKDDWAKTINIVTQYFNSESDLLYITWDNRGNSAGTANLSFSQKGVGRYESIVPFTLRGNYLPQPTDFELYYAYKPDFANGQFATCVSQSITDSTVNLVFDVPADCICYAVYMASRPGPIAVDEGTISYAIDDDEDDGNTVNPDDTSKGDSDVDEEGVVNAPKSDDSSDLGKNSYLEDAFDALDNIPTVNTEDKKSGEEIKTGNNVLNSDKQVVQIEGGNKALTTDFFKKLSKTDCIVEYTVVVNDKEYTVIIDSNNIKWLDNEEYYGPEWLISNYPIKGENGNTLSKGEYLIKEGDTLNKIAADLNTTADELAKKNGIKNKNFIRSGTKLKY